MKNLLRLIKTPYVDAQTLLVLFAEYRKPREHILRLIKNGELIRLKNGFYLIASKVEESGVTPYEQVANLLYGPSYISLEWALSFYGMIPERVHTITSVTLGKYKEFHTPIGNFQYQNIPNRSYSIGVTQMQAVSFIGGFLIATPEKAIADLVYKTCKTLNREQMLNELFESKRIEKESLGQLHKSLLDDISRTYHAHSVNLLVEIVKKL